MHSCYEKLALHSPSATRRWRHLNQPLLLPSLVNIVARWVLSHTHVVDPSLCRVRRRRGRFPIVSLVACAMPTIRSSSLRPLSYPTARPLAPVVIPSASVGRCSVAVSRCRKQSSLAASRRSPASPPLLTRHRVNRMARPRFCRSVRPNLKRFRNRPQSIPRYFLQKKLRPPLSSKDLPVNAHFVPCIYLSSLERHPHGSQRPKGGHLWNTAMYYPPPLRRATRALYPLSEKGYLIYLI